MDETDDRISKFGTVTEGQIRVNFHLTHERISHHSDIRHRFLKSLSIFRNGPQDKILRPLHLPALRSFSLAPRPLLQDLKAERAGSFRLGFVREKDLDIGDISSKGN